MHSAADRYDRMDPGDLMKAVASGSREALGVVYDRHAEDALAAAYRIVGSMEDARDVVQDLFVGLPRAAASYSDTGRLEGWIRRLATRTGLMALRSHRRRERRSRLFVERRPTHTRDPSDTLVLRQALAALPEPQRQVFVLKELEGYGHREIAETLGISAAASRVRLHRAWNSLRKGLEI